MLRSLMLLLALTFAFQASPSYAQDPYRTGPTFHGIRDFREVFPDILYRGGAHNGRAPLNSKQLNALCENNVGTSIYLYPTGFTGPKQISCSRGKMNYIYKNWQGSGKGVVEIHKMIYDAVKENGKPIFIHCWYGIHATGLVAATALMQFCDASAETAVKYWKVGIAPKLQYPKVIERIRSFKPNPNLQLSSSEKAAICPQL